MPVAKSQVPATTRVAVWLRWSRRDLVGVALPQPAGRAHAGALRVRFSVSIANRRGDARDGLDEL